MSEKEQQKYAESLKFFRDYLKKPGAKSDIYLYIAICLVQLDNPKEAKRHFGKAVKEFLKDRFWHRTSQPNWLVDTWVLSGKAGPQPKVMAEIEAYKQDRRGNSLVALYSYALMRLVLDRDSEVQEYVDGLLREPKVKYTYPMGRLIQAIVTRDQLAFDAALDDLLKAHRGMAKYGGLRETPEGYICLPAMSLSLVAMRRGMAINAESEYLPKNYLEYLQEERGY